MISSKRHAVSLMWSVVVVGFNILIIRFVLLFLLNSL